ncbi:MAG: TRAP transporter large permease subunit [Gammaproteobacteria bacterium]|nr:TRAP transporter large permease subunit [Gammaproteobacteria bacterium]
MGDTATVYRSGWHPSGFFAVSEAAAITAFYVFPRAQVLIHREVTVRMLPTVIRDSMVMVGSILLILGVSLAFTNYLIDAQIPQLLFEWVSSVVESKLMFLVLLNVILLVLGAILDNSAFGDHGAVNRSRRAPVRCRVGSSGIIFLANMQIGYVTPPIGMHLYRQLPLQTFDHRAWSGNNSRDAGAVGRARDHRLRTGVEPSLP